MRVIFIFSLFLFLFGGCSSRKNSSLPKPSSFICPEYKKLKCLTGYVACQFDEERGCEICVCGGIDEHLPAVIPSHGSASANPDVSYPHTK